MHARKSWDVLQVRAENNERFDDVITWKTFSTLLVHCEGNQSATGGFPSQRPVTRNLVVFDLRLNKRFNRQLKRSLITLYIWILNNSLDMKYNSVLDISASIYCYNYSSRYPFVSRWVIKHILFGKEHTNVMTYRFHYTVMLMISVKCSLVVTRVIRVNIKVTFG